MQNKLVNGQKKIFSSSPGVILLDSSEVLHFSSNSVDQSKLRKQTQEGYETASHMCMMSL